MLHADACDMFKCRKCQQWKDEGQFCSNQKLCLECNRSYNKEWYEKNRAKRRSQLASYDASRHQEVASKVCEYLAEHPCVDCGESDIVVLEFDHVQGKKIAAVSVLVSRRNGWRKVAAEIEKCEVVCANCHRRRTMKRAKQFRSTYPASVGHGY